jgi:NAD(P)-dependent dehydrogenase (short-subunit alcohol dehydrogenase family)
MGADDLLDMLSWTPPTEQNGGKTSNSRDALPAFAAAAATAPIWIPYVARVAATGQVYIGITLNYAARYSQHAGRLVDMNPIPGVSPMNYATAKGLEQSLIEAARRSGASVGNKINSISPNNPYYKTFMQLGSNWLQQCGKNASSFDAFWNNIKP